MHDVLVAGCGFVAGMATVCGVGAAVARTYLRHPEKLLAVLMKSGQ